MFSGEKRGNPDRMSIFGSNFVRASIFRVRYPCPTGPHGTNPIGPARKWSTHIHYGRDPERAPLSSQFHARNFWQIGNQSTLNIFPASDGVHRPWSLMMKIPATHPRGGIFADRQANRGTSRVSVDWPGWQSLSVRKFPFLEVSPLRAGMIPRLDFAVER
jgi:hypothetical protein